MKLSKYLEYMTPKERRGAFAAGQTSLATALDDNEIHQPMNSEFEKRKKDFYNSYMSKYITNVNKNKHDLESFRGIICHNGKYYTVSQDGGNHELLVRVALYDYQFPGLMNTQYIDWYENPIFLNNFLCITFNKSDPKRIYMSESYIEEPPESDLQTNQHLYNHYYLLCKKIFGKELIPEGIETKYDS